MTAKKVNDLVAEYKFINNQRRKDCILKTLYDYYLDWADYFIKNNWKELSYTKDDLFQEIRIVIWSVIEKNNNLKSYGGYFFAIVCNKTKDFNKNQFNEAMRKVDLNKILNNVDIN